MFSSQGHKFQRRSHKPKSCLKDSSQELRVSYQSWASTQQLPAQGEIRDTAPNPWVSPYLFYTGSLSKSLLPSDAGAASLPAQERTSLFISSLSSTQRPLAGPGCSVPDPARGLGSGKGLSLGRQTKTACARHTEHNEGLAVFAPQRFPLPFEEQGREAGKGLLWALAQLPNSPEDTGWRWSVSARGKSISKSKKGGEKKKKGAWGKERKRTIFWMRKHQSQAPPTLSKRPKGLTPVTQRKNNAPCLPSKEAGSDTQQRPLIPL